MGKLKGVSTRKDTGFGSRLADVLKRRRLTHAAAAKIACVKKSTLSSWVAGSVPQDTAALLRFCKELTSKNPEDPISFTVLLCGEPDVTNEHTEISAMFIKQEIISGLCEVTIKRLIPKKRDGGDE